MCQIAIWLLLLSTCFGTYTSVYAAPNVSDNNNNSQIMVQLVYPDNSVHMYSDPKLIDLGEQTRVELTNNDPNSQNIFFTISKELTQHIKDLQQKLFQEDVVFTHAGKIKDHIRYLSPDHVLIQIRMHRDPNTSKIKNHYEAQDPDFKIRPSLKGFKYERTTFEKRGQHYVSVNTAERTQYVAEADLIPVSISDLITQIKNSQTTFMVSSDSVVATLNIGSSIYIKKAIHPRIPYDEEHDLFVLHTNVPVTIVGLEKLKNGSWFAIFIPSKILETQLYKSEIVSYQYWDGFPLYRAPLALLYEQLYKPAKSADNRYSRRAWDKVMTGDIVSIDPITLDFDDVTALRNQTSPRMNYYELPFDFLNRVYLTNEIFLKPTDPSDPVYSGIDTIGYSSIAEPVLVVYDPKTKLYTIDKNALLQALDNYLPQYEFSAGVTELVTASEGEKYDNYVRTYPHGEVFSCKSVLLEGMQ